jgi:hypothetical protein
MVLEREIVCEGEAHYEVPEVRLQVSMSRKSSNSLGRIAVRRAIVEGCLGATAQWGCERTPAASARLTGDQIIGPAPEMQGPQRSQMPFCSSASPSSPEKQRTFMLVDGTTRKKRRGELLYEVEIVGSCT